MKTKFRGFTLVELMIVVVIIGVLAAVALPSYQNYVIKGNRAAAKAQMLDIANREQQYLLANRSYFDKATLVATLYTLPDNVSQKYTYDVTVGAGAVPSYLITFTPVIGSSQASDGALTLNNEGGKFPASKW